MAENGQVKRKPHGGLKDFCSNEETTSRPNESKHSSMTSPKPSDQDTRTKNIVRGIGYLSLQGVLTALLGFVLLSSLLRLLPTLDYGAYSSVQVSVGLASVLSVFGFGAAMVKFLAPESSQVGSSGWGAAKASLTLTILFSGVTSMALAAAAPYLSDYFLKGPSWAWVFYLGAIWLFATSVSGMFLAVLQGMRRYSLLAKVVLGSRLVATAVAVAGLVLYRSLQVAILSWVLYGAIISVGVFLLVRRSLIGADSRPYYSVVLKYAAPLGLAGIVTAIAGNADIVVVGGYLDPVSLGVYNATVIISSVVSFLFVGPLTTVLFAETSFSSEAHTEVSRGAALALRFGTLTVLPASLFATAMAPQLIDLFSGGGAYTRGIPYLQLIALFYIFIPVQAIAIAILQGVKRTRLVLAIGVVTALGELGLSVSLVPGLGLAGAAYSRVAVMVAGSVLSLYFIRDYLKGIADYLFFAKVIAASVIPTLAVLLLSTLISNRLITLVPYTLLGVGLYILCVKLLKLLGPDDKAFLAHLLPPSLQWISQIL